MAEAANVCSEEHSWARPSSWRLAWPGAWPCDGPRCWGPCVGVQETRRLNSWVAKSRAEAHPHPPPLPWAGLGRPHLPLSGPQHSATALKDFKRGLGDPTMRRLSSRISSASHVLCKASSHVPSSSLSWPRAHCRARQCPRHLSGPHENVITTYYSATGPARERGPKPNLAAQSNLSSACKACQACHPSSSQALPGVSPASIQAIHHGWQWPCDPSKVLTGSELLRGCVLWDRQPRMGPGLAAQSRRPS